MSALLDRARAARESWVNVGTMEVLIRRPTHVMLAKWREDDWSDIFRRIAIGWRGIRECDLVPGGDGAVPPFDAEVLVEWLEDRPDAYVEFLRAVVAVINAAKAQEEAAAGK